MGTSNQGNDCKWHLVPHESPIMKLTAATLVWQLCLIGITYPMVFEQDGWPVDGSVSGLNVFIDLKAEIASMIASGALAPLPQGDDIQEPTDTSSAWAEKIAEPAPTNLPEPQAEVADDLIVLKQKVLLLLKELVRVIQSPDEHGFRQLLSAASDQRSSNGSPGFDSVWQNQVLKYICRRYGLTLTTLPRALGAFERDSEVQDLLTKYNQEMHTLRQELASDKPR